jgi:protein PhnA
MWRRRKPEGVRTTTDKKKGLDEAIMTCTTCKDQIENPGNEFEPLEMLNDSMWNENSAVQVVAWRMLSRLRAAG